jgi:hypothetical protein
MGAALLAPLTLHLALLAQLSAVVELDEWVVLSAYIVGPAHISFAILAGVRAHRLALGRRAPSPTAVMWWTVLAANLPLPIVPAPIVLLTALPLVNLLGVLEVAIGDERGDVVAGELALPFAVVRPASPR